MYQENQHEPQMSNETSMLYNCSYDSASVSYYYPTSSSPSSSLSAFIASPRDSPRSENNSSNANYYNYNNYYHNPYYNYNYSRQQYYSNNSLNVSSAETSSYLGSTSSSSNASTPILNSSNKTKKENYTSAKPCKTKRTIACKNQLPDRAVDLLNEWFDDHVQHPYPSPEEKERLAHSGGISLKQVSAWFSNRRNRSQNTKPKRIKRQYEKEIASLVTELAQSNEHCIIANREKLIEKLQNTIKTNCSEHQTIYF